MCIFVMVLLKFFWIRKMDGIFIVCIWSWFKIYKCVCLRKFKFYMGYKVIDEEDIKFL